MRCSITFYETTPGASGFVERMECFISWISGQSKCLFDLFPSEISNKFSCS